jgi:hypothetical protein
VYTSAKTISYKLVSFSAHVVLLWLTENTVVCLFAEHNQFWRLDYNVTFLTATQLALERGLVKVTAGGVEPSAIPPKPEITREMPSIVWAEYSLFVL